MYDGKTLSRRNVVPDCTVVGTTIGDGGISRSLQRVVTPCRTPPDGVVGVCKGSVLSGVTLADRKSAENDGETQQHKQAALWVDPRIEHRKFPQTAIGEACQCFRFQAEGTLIWILSVSIPACLDNMMQLGGRSSCLLLPGIACVPGTAWKTIALQSLIRENEQDWWCS